MSSVKGDLENVSQEMAAKGLRVLGLSFKLLPISKAEALSNVEVEEKDLIFIGFAGLIDPPREVVKEAIQRCKVFNNVIAYKCV